MDEGAKGILWVFLGIGLIWLFLGGPARMAERSGLFIKPPDPLGTGETYGGFSLSANKQTDINTTTMPTGLTEQEQVAWQLEQTKKELKEAKETLAKIQAQKATSPYSERVKISRCRGSRTNVNEEYIKLTTNLSPEETVNISNWTLKSGMTGREVLISNASKLPRTSQINSENPVFVSEKEDVYIVTGRSPIGVSFQTNLCSGYLEQFQDFEPSLDKKCPLVEDEDLPLTGPNAFNDDCWDYIEKISRCETPLSFPVGMQHECRQYLTTKVNYNACVDTHKNEANFYQPEWRIFLNRRAELWKDDREIIQLLDTQDRLVDVYSY